MKEIINLDLLANCAYGLCGKQFCKKKPSSRFCSLECYKLSRPALEQRVCFRDGCESSFVVKPSDRKRYCGSSCAAKVNNVTHPKRTLSYNPYRTCKECNKDFVIRYKNGGDFCNRSCRSKYERKIYVESWLNGEIRGGDDRSVHDFIREYLIEQANFTCTREGCGFNTPHPVDGRSILEVDHINGDGTDHCPENLKVLCPNDHALTPTYRGRNTGRGRPYKYNRTLLDK